MADDTPPKRITGKTGVFSTFIIKKAPQITVAEQVDFGGAPPGDARAPIELVIENTGKHRLDIASVVLSGPDAAAFSLDEQGLQRALERKQSTAVRVSCTLSEPGVKEATLTVTSNADNRPEATVALKAAAFALKELKMPEFFAAGHEEIAISYEVVDPGQVVSQGTVKIFAAGGEAPLIERALEAKEHAGGAQSFKFDGQVGGMWGRFKNLFSSGDFPDNVLTADHSPYKVEISVAAATGQPAQVEGSLKVEVGSIKLELGAPSLLKDPRHQEVVQELAALPAAGEKKKIFLRSNLFSTDLKDSKAYDPTSYDAYEKLWGDGPNIPIVARLLVKDSKGGEIEAPKALGKLSVQWDYQDLPCDTSKLRPVAKSFVDKALQFKTDEARPKGDNCFGGGGEEDRGGKRTADASRSVFPLSASFKADVQSFPYEVEAAVQRKWSAYSQAQTSGAQAGTTGIIFRPSRMAGDAYKLVCRVDPGRKLDTPEEVQAPVQAETGELCVWRRLEIARIFQRAPSITLFDHATVAEYFARCFIDLVQTAKGPEPIPRYSERVAAFLKKSGDLLSHGVKDPDNHEGAGIAALTFHDFDGFLAAFGAAKGLESDQVLKALAEGWKCSEERSSLESRYHCGLADYASECAEEICCAVIKEDHTEEGLCVFLFGETDNHRKGAFWLKGLFPSGTHNPFRERTSYIQYARAEEYKENDSIDMTVAHEIGHAVFLLHTRFETAADDDMGHDAVDDACLMSYNYARKRAFCGFCNLRMRGWNHTRLSIFPDRNSKLPLLSVGGFDGFGAVRVGAERGLELALTNLGGAPVEVSSVVIEGDAAADFSCEPQAGVQVEAGGSASLKLSVKPAKPSARRATLVIASNDGERRVELVADGLPAAAKVPELSVEPDPIEFGKKSVGTGGGSQMVKLKNVGSEPVSLLAGKDEAFKLSGPGKDAFLLWNHDKAALKTLQPGEEVEIKVNYEPKSDGAQAATLAIHADGGVKEVALSGTAMKGKIEVSPVEVFGRVAVNSTAFAKTVRIKNVGGGDLHFRRVSVEGEAGGDFKVQMLDPVKGPKLEKQLEDEKKKLANLKECERDRAKSANSSAIAGFIMSGTSGQDRIKRVERTIQQLEEQLAGLSRSRILIDPLPPGKSEQVYLAFKPAEQDERAAELVVEARDLEPIRIPLNGVGIKVDPVLLLPDGSEARILSNPLPTTELGQSSTLTLTIENRGNAECAIDGIKIGKNPELFKIANDQVSGTKLGPGARATFDLVCTPQEAGVVETSVQLRSPDSLSLSNGFEGKVVAGSLELPARMSFEAQPKQEEVTQTIKLKNPGSHAIKILNAEVGDGLLYFRVMNTPAVVPAGGTADLEVRYKPFMGGESKGKLTIEATSKQGQHEIELVGKTLGD